MRLSKIISRTHQAKDPPTHPPALLHKLFSLFHAHRAPEFPRACIPQARSPVDVDQKEIVLTEENAPKGCRRAWNEVYTFER